MKTILFFALIIISLISHQAIALPCTVTGEVKGRDSKTLVLRKCSESSKVLYENPVVIPITNGRFSHTFSYSDHEAYELVFQDELEVGVWRSIVFFPETQVTFILYPQKDADSNVIRGGTSNVEYADYQIKARSLFESKQEEISKVRQALQQEDAYESEEYKAVLKQLRALRQDDYDGKTPVYQKMDEMEKTRTRYTEKGRALVMDRQDSLKNAMFLWKYNYMQNNPSLASYYLMWSDVVMQIKNDPTVAKLVMATFPVFKEKYPNHVYTAKISAQLTGIRTIAVGNRYIDFKAPTLRGDTLQLSALIKNKVALIDLWGSWCGPCIAKSRLVVPIYQAYKSKGFEVVGIAREFKSAEALKKRLAKEQFSWTNLVELDDRQNIWNLYGISNGTGLMVLVDRDGIILSVDPKPEELEKILQDKL